MNSSGNDRNTPPESHGEGPLRQLLWRMREVPAGISSVVRLERLQNIGPPERVLARKADYASPFHPTKFHSTKEDAVHSFVWSGHKQV